MEGKTGAKVASLIDEFEGFPIDRKSIPRGRLDLDERARRSQFQWSGQFPPELIEALLERYATPESRVLDPFCGSGTVPLEAARKSIACLGVDINPAAVALARTVLFCGLEPDERKMYLDRAWKLLEPIWREPSEDKMRHLLKGLSEDPFVHNIVINIIMRLSISRTLGVKGAFESHRRIIEGLPYSTQPYVILHSDARQMPIPDGTADLVITSPPYAGVFEYRKNYKRAVWLAEIRQSSYAKSEIGSEKKGLGNRFLLIVQYALDMAGALHEIRRVLKGSGRLILIVRRESEMKGAVLKDSALLYALAAGACGFRMVLRQERRFSGRSGVVLEDILHFDASKSAAMADKGFPTAVAVHFLNKMLATANGNERTGLLRAIREAQRIRPSPIYDCKSL